MEWVQMSLAAILHSSTWQFSSPSFRGTSALSATWNAKINKSVSWKAIFQHYYIINIKSYNIYIIYISKDAPGFFLVHPESHVNQFGWFRLTLCDLIWVSTQHSEWQVGSCKAKTSFCMDSNHRFDPPANTSTMSDWCCLWFSQIWSWLEINMFIVTDKYLEHILEKKNVYGTWKQCSKYST